MTKQFSSQFSVRKFYIALCDIANYNLPLDAITFTLLLIVANRKMEGLYKIQSFTTNILMVFNWNSITCFGIIK